MNDDSESNQEGNGIDEARVWKSASKPALVADQKLHRTRIQRLAGNTTFTESRNIAKMIPCERLYLKFEGNNPTGTQKDRISLALAELAASQSFDGIATATCGNFGAAIAHAANFFRIPETHIFIPKGYHVPVSRLKIMQRYNAEIHFIEGTYEHAVFYSSELAKENNWFDANPGGDRVSEISREAYAGIAYEIFRSLRRAPDYVLCPVGNGSTLSGIHLGFKRLYNSNKTQKLPRMIAVSTRRGNPVIKSFKSKSPIILDLSPSEIRETRVNEPLTNWHAFDGQEALDSLYESKGFGEYASDSQMIEFSKVLKEEEGLIVHPASASTLAVLSKLTKNDIKLEGTYVAVLTGRYS
ncbi:MAG: pyridoxal-phosphate dependent enzyme [Candidatus Odinarchaeota archaeon]